MGGERRSTMTQRERGLICWKCGNPTRPNPAHGYGERLCAACEPPPARPYCVLMTFRGHADGFSASFELVQAQGARISIGKHYRRLSQASLHGMIQRTADDPSSDLMRETLKEVDGNIHTHGCGSIFLNLTEPQYRALREGKRR